MANLPLNRIPEGYTLKDNARSRVVKGDPADRIVVEIGDTKQPDFKPQVKIMRCKTCGRELLGRNKSYCSTECRGKKQAWNKGKSGYSTKWRGGKHSEEAKEKMRQAAIGRKMPEEQRKKLSEALKGRIPKNLKTLDNSGPKSHWWRGGITPEHEKVRKSTEYKKWRTAVFERDDYTCQEYNARSAEGHRVVLNADHIKQFALYPELRFDVSNGRTLCIDCHRRTPTWGRTIEKAYATN